jgi:serine/threonine-protein kinase HipA
MAHRRSFEAAPCGAPPPGRQSELQTRRLRVSLGGTHVGFLELERRAGHCFLPEQAWLEGGQRPRLGALFTRRPGRLDSTHVPLWFENLLPEKGSLLRRLLAALHGLREGQSFDLLRVLGCDLPGAVRVDSEDASSRDQGPRRARERRT